MRNPERDDGEVELRARRAGGPRLTDTRVSVVVSDVRSGNHLPQRAATRRP